MNWHKNAVSLINSTVIALREVAASVAVSSTCNIKASPDSRRAVLN